MRADLSSHAVLFHQGLLGEVDHEGIIRAQAHIHAPSKEGGEGVAVIVQEQAVVGQRTHAQTHLPSIQMALDVSGMSDSVMLVTHKQGSGLP